MRRKGWLIPVLVFFICIVVLIFYQNNKTSELLATPSDNTPILWQENITDINGLTFIQGDTTITATKVKGIWHVFDNKGRYEADSTYIYNILSGFISPKLHTLEDPDPKVLSLYGISNYSKKIILYNNNNHSYEIICGNTFDENHYYVCINNNVYTLNKEYFDIIDEDIFKWRNKNILNFNEKDYAKIYVSYNNALHTLIASENDTGISFVCQSLSSDQIEDLLTYLKALRVQDYLIDHPDDLLISQYGLDNPTMKFTLYSKSGKAVTLSVGKTSRDDNIAYAMLSSSKTIFTVLYVDNPVFSNNNKAKE